MHEFKLFSLRIRRRRGTTQRQSQPQKWELKAEKKILKFFGVWRKWSYRAAGRMLTAYLLIYIYTYIYLYIGIPTTCVSVHFLWTLLQFQLFCLWFTLQMKLSLGAALFFSLSQQEQQRNLIMTFINDFLICNRGFLYRKLYILEQQTSQTAHWLSICLSIWYWLLIALIFNRS